MFGTSTPSMNSPDPMPGAERQHEHDALAVASGTEANLGEAGGIGVVDDVHVRRRPPR